MKYCVHCGNELFDEAVVCPKCGCPTALNQATPVRAPGNGIAVAGFVLSFFSIFFIPAILGLIFGIIGLRRSNRRNGKNRGLAIAAIVMTSIYFTVLLYVFAS